MPILFKTLQPVSGDNYAGVNDLNTFIIIGARCVTVNWCFTNDIDHMAGSNSERQGLTNKLIERAGAYGRWKSK